MDNEKKVEIYRSFTKDELYGMLNSLSKLVKRSCAISDSEYFFGYTRACNEKYKDITNVFEIILQNRQNDLKRFLEEKNVSSIFEVSSYSKFFVYKDSGEPTLIDEFCDLAKNYIHKNIYGRDMTDLRPLLVFNEDLEHEYYDFDFAYQNLGNCLDVLINSGKFGIKELDLSCSKDKMESNKTFCDTLRVNEFGVRDSTDLYENKDVMMSSFYNLLEKTNVREVLEFYIKNRDAVKDYNRMMYAIDFIKEKETYLGYGKEIDFDLPHHTKGFAPITSLFQYIERKKLSFGKVDNNNKVEIYRNFTNKEISGIVDLLKKHGNCPYKVINARKYFDELRVCDNKYKDITNVFDVVLRTRKRDLYFFLKGESYIPLDCIYNYGEEKDVISEFRNVVRNYCKNVRSLETVSDLTHNLVIKENLTKEEFDELPSKCRPLFEAIEELLNKDKLTVDDFRFLCSKEFLNSKSDSMFEDCRKITKKFYENKKEIVTLFQQVLKKTNMGELIEEYIRDKDWLVNNEKLFVKMNELTEKKFVQRTYDWNKKCNVTVNKWDDRKFVGVLISDLMSRTASHLQEEWDKKLFNYLKSGDALQDLTTYLKKDIEDNWNVNKKTGIVKFLHEKPDTSSLEEALVKKAVIDNVKIEWKFGIVSWYDEYNHVFSLREYRDYGKGKNLTCDSTIGNENKRNAMSETWDLKFVDMVERDC